MRSGKRKGETEMDEIERTELIGRLRKLSGAWAELGYWEGAELITKAAREIKEKQERTESPWISTADRLPEEEKDVLILVKETDNTFGTGHPDVCYWQFVGWMIDGRWETVYCHGNRAISDENARGNSVHQVTHWMPLPDLPKEE